MAQGSGLETMSKTLLVGPAGCGKTHELLDAFAKALAGAPDPLAEDLFFVVPSAEHTERVVSLLIQRGLEGFFHRRVTTLSRLAGEIFRVPDIPVVSGLTRAMIVRDILRENAWDYFKAVSDQPGFAGLMAQFVTELKEACIPPQVFRERMNALKGFEPAFGAKYEALAAFFEQYEARLKKQGLRDSQDALHIFRDRKKGSDPISLKRGQPPFFSSLWIDGFFDFSNLQLEYLRELSAITDEITITLTREEGSGGQDAFEPVRETERRLKALGFEVRKMKPVARRTEKQDLLYLQKNLFRGISAAGKKGSDPLKTSGGQAPFLEDIVILDAIGTEGEVELIAREIHKLCAAGDFRYSDCAVLFRQIRDYAPVVASVFARYGIPAEIHERERLKFSSWIAAATSLLAVFKNGWEREDLFAFLRSPHTRFFGKDLPVDREWLAELEQRSFLEGVGMEREAWLADWKRGETADLASFNQRKIETLRALRELEERFLAAKSVDEHTRLFRDAVYGTFGVLETSDLYTSFTRRDAACAGRFEALLDEVRQYFLKAGAAAVSFESFADHFLGLVELDVYSLHERDKNRVHIYDVSLARQKEYRVVFVAGLLERVFPMQVREDPLLSDWERKLMNGGMAHPLAERLPRQDIERFFFYTAVTRAKERLYLSCPRLDFEGKESLPSFYLEEARELFGGRIPVISQNLSRPFPKIEEAITRRELEIAVAGVLRDPSEPDPSVRKAADLLAGDPGSRERFLAALEPVEAKIRDEKILKGGPFAAAEMSPTRLETYGKCPFRYFAEKILKLKETGEDVRAMQKGNILHHVLQQYFDPHTKRDPKETLEAFLRREMEEGLKKNPMTWAEPYEEELDRRELFGMLKGFLEDEMERLKSSFFRPRYTEHSFGDGATDDSPALKIETDAGEVKLRGRVDRIDTDKDRKFAVVIDYKRSASLKTASLELGTALQLPLYLLAARKHLGLEPLGAAIYSLRDCKRSGFYCEGIAQAFEKEFSRSTVPDEVFRRVLDRSLEFVRKFTKGIRAAEIPVRPRDCESFCPYDTVCRIEKWRLPLILEEIKDEDRKNGDSSLAPRDS